MATLIGLLRAVNVGGTGKLPMAEFREMCVAAGLRDVRTYIQSGNVVFSTSLGAPAAKKKLEALLAARLGKPCQVLVRTQAELESVVARNPFPEAEPNRLMIIFLDDAPPRSAIADVKVPGRERLQLDGRELFIHFPDGMGSSKLRVPFAAVGTGRNLNTVRKLIEMAAG